MRFPVQVDGEQREVEITFGDSDDVASLNRWRFSEKSQGHESIRDALEFARLASKRWRYYCRTGAAAISLAGLHAAILRDAHAEIAMVLVARATWPSATPFLGFAYFRRSWCHHFIVDFLSAHPRVIQRRPEAIRGVGAGILLQLVALAGDVGVPCIWGEATVHSAPFYERTLDVQKILDHFFIRDSVLAHCHELLRMRK